MFWLSNITGFDGINRSHPWSGTPDSEWDYKNWNGAKEEMPSIPQNYIDQFSLRDLGGLIANLEGVGNTKYQQGLAEGRAQAAPRPVAVQEDT